MFVFSTLSTDQRYLNHEKGGGDVPVPIGDGVLIHGGANVINKTLHTPKGVVTKIDAEDLEYLRANAVFVQHEANGFIVVSNSNEDPEKVAASSMKERDPSAQLEEADFEEGGAPTLVTDEPVKPSKAAKPASRRRA